MAFVELPVDAVQVVPLKAAVSVYDVPSPNRLSNKDQFFAGPVPVVVTPIQYWVLAATLWFNPERLTTFDEFVLHRSRHSPVARSTLLPGRLLPVYNDTVKLPALLPLVLKRLISSPVSVKLLP